MSYTKQYEEAEHALRGALDAVTRALTTVKGVRREHVQVLDRVRTTLEQALEELRKARPKGAL
ncbi:MAG: hypothetical protein ACRELC_01835 [Gemmatimonadota bacterium]